jgi:hypothetical protein
MSPPVLAMLFLQRIEAGAVWRKLGRRWPLNVTGRPTVVTDTATPYRSRPQHYFRYGYGVFSTHASIR